MHKGKIGVEGVACELELVGKQTCMCFFSKLTCVCYF